ncbi:MAG TPA: glycosyl hydrolase 53 family protein [Phycisphaerae bacterium]|nr:glycosyl hydrolase 53 family protein [Phycisphaerae bacterium]
MASHGMTRRQWLKTAALAAAAPVLGGSGDDGFQKGGDVSLLQKIEELGGVYRHDGRPRDALAIFKGHGCNTMRLRLFHSPGGKGPVVNDLAYTQKLARRIKAAGLGLLLDFHYSDTWADPGHQTKPRAWKDLSFEQLQAAVFTYTRDAVAALDEAGARPDVVQVGNEITPGMLWDTGRVGGKFDTPQQWRQLATLVQSGIRGVREAAAGGRPVRVMIHVDRGGSTPVTQWFFDHLRAEGVDFDVIGLSYYPWWHGPLDGLRQNLAATALRYAKDIVVVETAYPWTGQMPEGRRNAAGDRDVAPYPLTPEGQKVFLAELIRTVRQTPDGRGKGVLYWAPEWMTVEGLPSSWASRALFDPRGNALAALSAFAE